VQSGLYNWRRTYGGMDADAAKELKELREQNGRLKRLLAQPPKSLNK
jgi:putative transposase